MVLILNLLALALLLWGLALSIWLKKWWPVVAVLVVELMLVFVQPSYTPRGTVEKSSVMEFEEKELAMEERLKEPELTAQERMEQINERMDAVEQATEKQNEQ